MVTLKEVGLNEIRGLSNTPNLEWYVLNEKKLCLVEIKDKYLTRGYHGFIEYLKDGRVVLSHNSKLEIFPDSNELNKRLTQLKLPTIDDGVSSAFSILSDSVHKR